MKKTFTKILAVALCAVLLVTGSVYITLAYLQSQSNVVQNTFTTSNIRITLDETKIGADGNPTNERTDKTADAIQNYKLTPGASYVKDPIVNVEASSENCFIVIAIHDSLFNGVDDALQENYIIKGENDVVIAEYGKIYEQITANGWKKLEGYHIQDKYFAGDNNLMANWLVKDDSGNVTKHDYTLYYYAGKTDGESTDAIVVAGEQLDIFKGFTLAGSVEPDVLDDLNDTSFEIVAFGMQTTDYDAHFDTLEEDGEKVAYAFKSTFGKVAPANTENNG